MTHIHSHTHTHTNTLSLSHTRTHTLIQVFTFTLTSSKHTHTHSLTQHTSPRVYLISEVDHRQSCPAALTTFTQPECFGYTLTHTHTHISLIPSSCPVLLFQLS